MGGGGETMAGCEWWWQTYACLWVVVGGGSKIMAGRRWLWLIVDDCDWLHDLVIHNLWHYN